MSKLSTEQLEFARQMTKRQWSVLLGLADASFHLSASEWADLELYALVKNRLAQCFTPAPGVSALWGWTATDAGKFAVKLRAAGKLLSATKPPIRTAKSK